METHNDPVCLTVLKTYLFLPSMTERTKVIGTYISPLAFPAFPIFFPQFTRDQEMGFQLPLPV